MARSMTVIATVIAIINTNPFKWWLIQPTLPHVEFDA